MLTVYILKTDSATFLSTDITSITQKALDLGLLGHVDVYGESANEIELTEIVTEKSGLKKYGQNICKAAIFGAGNESGDVSIDVNIVYVYSLGPNGYEVYAQVPSSAVMAASDHEFDIKEAIEQDLQSNIFSLEINSL